MKFYNKKNIIELKIKNKPKIIKFSCKKLQNDEEFILKLFTINPLIYKYISYKLYDNHEFIIRLIILNNKYKYNIFNEIFQLISLRIKEYYELEFRY